jgi:hypothetical protein
MTRFLIAAAVGGRPGLRRVVLSHLREINRRCQAVQDGGRSHREGLCPAATRHEPGQGGEPHPVGRRVMHPSDLSAQHGVLVTQDQQFGILAQVSPQQHSGQTEQTTRESVQDRQQQHPMMIHAHAAHEERRSERCIEFPSPTRYQRTATMITSGGKRNPAKPNVGAGTRTGRGRISSACPELVICRRNSAAASAVAAVMVCRVANA